MKLQFDPHLEFQQEAIAAIKHVFDGQETCYTNLSVEHVTHPPPTELPFAGSDLGVGNHLRLLEQEILRNVQAIQLRNGLSPSRELQGMNFTVEMETGTGKTYVYLRTVFELHQEFGFTKFIIVVPSVAIKEGVYKSLQITEEHFKALYENVQYDYFVYDSQKLGQVRSFASSDYIQIMVINIDAFRKSFTDPSKESQANVIHRPHDRMAGNRPIEFVQATNPIVIIDEPQSVDTTAKSKEAIESLHPLCTIRYSATHIDKHNMMYRLDSVDAYERKLVKQIEVAGIQVQDSHNQAHLKLLKVDNRNNQHKAHVELDIRQRNGGVRRRRRTVRRGDDLEKISGGRDIYAGYIVDDIYCEPGRETISFTGQPEIIKLHEASGDVHDDQYKRLQIRKTIEEHLDKELALRPRGLKVLSLFFIDRVAHYRSRDDHGKTVPGKYALMFEEEYDRAIRQPSYRHRLASADLETAAARLHGGYFADDRKYEGRKAGDVNSNAKCEELTYNLIMRDKEKLLSFDSPLRFIFSHSALREGWDNPNVFQICTLNETRSIMKKRQEVGRGLRIAVNQDGERVFGSDVNRLTIVANESYEDFARQLQQEIEEDSGIKFGVVQQHLFAGIPVIIRTGETGHLGFDASRRLWEHLQAKGYIDQHGNVQDALRQAIKDETVDLPDEVADQQAAIHQLLRKVSGRLHIRNSDARQKVPPGKAAFLSSEFQRVWNRIQQGMTFRVDFDGEKLIEECVEEIASMPGLGKACFQYQKALTTIDRRGVGVEQTHASTHVHDARDFQLPDIVSHLQHATQLTRRSIVAILTRSGRLQDFQNNPQEFIERVTTIIASQLRRCIGDGIKYQLMGGQQYYAQELCSDNELYRYLSRNILACNKSTIDHVDNESAAGCESEVERRFAAEFETNDEIKLFARLPGEFRIDTPLGFYKPDWAVLVKDDGQERLYFVSETRV